jgi:hypothetical protein
MITASTHPLGRVTLCWMPLGAGQHVVRACGQAYEALSALAHRRPPRQLYHSALVIDIRAGRFLIEMAPVPDADRAQRGVVAEGPVGLRRANCFRLFRYELRRWHDGVIPDERQATSTVVGVDLDRAERLFGLVPSIPTPVWGRDELGTGEMWNSNSVTSWLLEQSRFDTTQLAPPASGRAPGWHAGLVAARRGKPWPVSRDLITT